MFLNFKMFDVETPDTLPRAKAVVLLQLHRIDYQYPGVACIHPNNCQKHLESIHHSPTMTHSNEIDNQIYDR